jgi:hypothetical protein
MWGVVLAKSNSSSSSGPLKFDTPILSSCTYNNHIEHEA